MIDVYNADDGIRLAGDCDLSNVEGPKASGAVSGAARDRSLIAMVACAAAGAAVLGFIWPSLWIPAAISVLAAGAIFAAFKNYQFFVCMVIAYFFFNGFLKKVFSDHIVVFFVRDILLACLYFGWFVKYPLKRGVRGRYDKFAVGTLIAFVFYTLAVTLIPFTNEPLIFRLGGVRWWLAFVPLFFVGADALDTPRRFDRFCWLFMVLAAVTATYGVIQYAIGFDHLYGLSSNFRASANWGTWTGADAPLNLRTRVFSTFDLATTFAAMLRVACILGVAYFVNSRKRMTSVFLGVVIGVCFSALLLTGTRAAYVPLAAGLLVYALIEPRRKRLLLPVVALAGGFSLVMVLSETAYLYRITLVVTDYQYTIGRVLWDWEKALYLVRDYPLGLGISTSAKTGEFIDPVLASAGWEPTYRFIEHGFGQALVSLGWPGLAFFAVMVTTVLTRLGVTVREAPDDTRWRSVLVFVLCFSELLPLFTHASLNFGMGPVMFWLLSGSILAMHGRRPSTRKEVGDDTNLLGRSAGLPRPGVHN
jgi:hypothetical protein